MVQMKLNIDQRVGVTLMQLPWSVVDSGLVQSLPEASLLGIQQGANLAF